ncbi:hypothetical protein SARC_06099 [Sphaeroforma arctica JP610]|uniref:Uncharacterized protein n=1 Tax=Sphaeroforma arctica JP610 TaxID=667725 RepID=A0A0L0G081_9EUKA|nr:hypothetical protein SARC_06099 [Sphaeroforma arctica JP610]KNC81598.1 hypothetical protein SARC_06099 [Sphaeroforma arctica JP610]|eukprot:XP_014155500.1 hypothetical protein SARC_06099 [Sphaeroforma arctica JP610]
MLVAANYSDPDGLGLPNIGTITGYLNEQPRAPTPTNNPSTAPAAATGAAPMPSNVPAPSMNNLPPPPQTQAQPPNQIPTSALPPVLAHTHPNPPPSVQQQQQAQATIDPTGDTPTPIPTQSTDQSAGQDGTHMHKQLQAESTPQKPPGATVDV